MDKHTIGIVSIPKNLLDSTIGKHLIRTYLQSAYSLRGTEVTVSFDGISADLLARNEGQVERIKRIEREEQPVIQNLVQNTESSDVFFDIGADFGIYSCLLGRIVGSEGVIPFEPYQPRVARLELNLGHNDLDCSIVTRALGSAEGTLEGYSKVFERDQPNVVSGDELVDSNEVPAPTVLKVDVDGGEVNVLDGLRDTLRNFVQLIVVEVHPRQLQAYSNGPDQVATILEETGFSTDRFVDRPDSDIFYVKGEK